MKLISFLITVYNLDMWLLERCIDSLLMQDIDETDFEIVMIDDGSDVSVESILQKYPNTAIRFYRQTNQGLGAARNKALSLAYGKYCFFVDGDDYLFANSLPSVVDCLRQDDPDILKTDFRNCYQKEPIQITFPALKYRKYLSGCDYIKSHYLTGGNWIIFRKELAEKHQLSYPEKVLHEDEEFIAKLFLFAETVIVSNRPVYAYYYRSESIVHHSSIKQEVKRLNDFLEITNRLLSFSKQYPLSNSQQEAIQRKIDFLGIDFLRKIMRTKTSEEYLKYYRPQLKQMNLYPPAYRSEGMKYHIFRIFVQSVSGRRILQLLDRYRAKKF